MSIDIHISSWAVPDEQQALSRLNRPVYILMPTFIRVLCRGRKVWTMDKGNVDYNMLPSAFAFRSKRLAKKFFESPVNAFSPGQRVWLYALPYVQ